MHVKLGHKTFGVRLKTLCVQRVMWGRRGWPICSSRHCNRI